MKHADEVRKSLKRITILKHIESTIDSLLNGKYNPIEYVFENQKTADDMMEDSKKLVYEYEKHGWCVKSFVPTIWNGGKTEYDRDSDRTYDLSRYGFKTVIELK